MLGPGKRYWKDRIIRQALQLAALSSIIVTSGIVAILLIESSTFFRHVSLWEFLTDTQWTPLFAEAHYGILPLVAGTLVTTAVARGAAGGNYEPHLPSEYAPFSFAKYRHSWSCSRPCRPSSMDICALVRDPAVAEILA